ncbi:hypothetical protein ACVBEF_05795 [Glaciimonas sp. GG7]
MIDPRLWLAGLALGVAAYLVGGHNEARYWQAREVAATTKAKAILEQAIIAKDQAEATMRSTISDIQHDQQSKITTITASRDAALRELRRRPARRPDAATGNAAAAIECRGASGAELSKEDASFLVGEAARADADAERLNACLMGYEVARKVWLK